MKNKNKDIVESMRLIRKTALKEIGNIQDQIARISKAIDILDPKPEVLVAGRAPDQYKSKFLEVIGREPLTAREIRRKSGFMSESQTYKYLKELTESGKLQMVEINNVRHYRKPREELRLIAGHGVSSYKREKRMASK